MSLVSNDETIKILLPVLIALIAALLVIIPFLFKQYTLKRDELPYIKKPYSNLIKLLFFALFIAGITTILSLLYIIKFTNDILYCFILILFVVTVVMIFIGTVKTAIIILKG
jgi:hypothetical protein